MRSGVHIGEIPSGEGCALIHRLGALNTYRDEAHPGAMAETHRHRRSRVAWPIGDRLSGAAVRRHTGLRRLILKRQRTGLLGDHSTRTHPPALDGTHIFMS
jgi:hypothetical protein